MELRPEKPGDEDAIHVLTEAAFKPMSFSDDTEADCLKALRADGDLILSLVAVENDEIVGHVAFSPASVGAETEGWIGIGPISVAPARQKNGIGSALMNEGLIRIKAKGAKGCVLTGDPAYYQRFGFMNNGPVTYLDTSTKYVQWLTFSGNHPSGELVFSDGLQE